MILSSQARNDLTGIFLYIASENVESAINFIADIHSKIEWIAKTDFTGSPRDYISEGLRALPYRKRCIYYRSYQDRITIVRVLHSAQDVTQQEFEGK